MKKNKDRNDHEEEYSVSVVNIRHTGCGKVPEMISLNIPSGIMRLRNSDLGKFYDEVESFAYNCISKKYGVEVTYCQVLLPG